MNYSLLLVPTHNSNNNVCSKPKIQYTYFMNFNAQYLNYTVSTIYDKFNAGINIKYGVKHKYRKAEIKLFSPIHNIIMQYDNKGE